jgi:hypothetical protein
LEDKEKIMTNEKRKGKRYTNSMRINFENYRKDFDLFHVGMHTWNTNGSCN